MNPHIFKAVEKVKEARKYLQLVVLKHQKLCPHVEVLHYNSSGDYPRRLCVDCGLEELGSWWSIDTYWRRRSLRDEPFLGNERGRSVRKVGLDEFCQHRIEGSEVPTSYDEG